MVLAGSKPSSDVFQDGFVPGVKELFEAHEEELLPVEEQLKHYKKRDLYASHFHRTSCKVFGPRESVRRLHHVTDDPFVVNVTEDEEKDRLLLPEIELPPYYEAKHRSPTPHSDNLTTNAMHEDTPEELEDWIQKRMALRKSLNDIGLEQTWLMKKPHKTNLETRVLYNLYGKLKLKESPSKQSKLDEKALPPHLVLKSLMKIANHCLHNNVLLSMFETNEDYITYQQCVNGLERLAENMTLSSVDIDEVLDHYFKDGSTSDTFYSTLISIMQTIDPNFVPSSSLDVLLARRSEIEDGVTSKRVSEISGKEGSKTLVHDSRTSRVKEFNETLEACRKSGVGVSESTLRKVLLHPGDIPFHSSRTSLAIHQPSAILSQDFWKVKNEKKPKRRKIGEFEQETKLGNLNSDNSFASADSTINSSEDEATGRDRRSSYEMMEKDKRSGEDRGRKRTIVLPALVDSSSSRKFSPEAVRTTKFRLRSLPFTPKAFPVLKRAKGLQGVHAESSEDTLSDTTSSPPSTTNIISFPRLRDVTAEKQMVNLSTGRAFIGRKVDCWLSLEEYQQMSKTRLVSPLRRERASENAFWPGQLSDKIRLCRSPCQPHRFTSCENAKSKGSIFHQVNILPHNGKRSNYGYDNILTWPTDGQYVKYGDIELNKSYVI